MTTGNYRNKHRQFQGRIIAASIIVLASIWTTQAVAEERPDSTLNLFGTPLSIGVLRNSSGQGMDSPVATNPNDTSIISVILWDEAKRRPSPPPPINTGTTSLTSTIIGTH